MSMVRWKVASALIKTKRHVFESKDTPMGDEGGFFPIVIVHLDLIVVLKRHP